MTYDPLLLATCRPVVEEVLEATTLTDAVSVCAAADRSAHHNQTAGRASPALPSNDHVPTPQLKEQS